MRKDRFCKDICVRHERDEEYDIIIGVPSRLDQLDAEDGDRVAIYRLQEVVTFRKNPTLT